MIDDAIPQGWARVPLRDVVSPSKAKVEPNECPTARYLSLEHIEGQTTRIIGHGTGADVASTKSVFEAGDVLYGKLRPYLNKVCVPDFDGICSTDILVFPKSRFLESRFLLRFLMQRSVVEHAHHHSVGVQLPRVSFDRLAEIDFPLPPLAEQRRIVAKVEELLSRVNAARERLAKAPTILKRFRQSVLAAACSGQLTADWRGKIVGQEWSNRQTVEEVAEIVGGFAYKSPTFEKEGTNQVLRIGNVRPEGIDFSAAPVFVSDEIAALTARYKLEPNDIVLSMTGTRYKRDYGYPAIVPQSLHPLFVNQRVSRVRCRPGMLPRFLLYWMQSDEFKDHFFSGETGNVNQGNVGVDGIRKAPIAPVTLNEQREVVRRIDLLFGLADKIESRVQAAKARVEKITQSILAKAFRGELVPTEAEIARQEGRDYEPAADLLNRICKGLNSYASRSRPAQDTKKMKSSPMQPLRARRGPVR